jgi:hypothetical protein
MPFHVIAVSGWGIAGLCVLLFGGLAGSLWAASRTKIPPLEIPPRVEWEPPPAPARGVFVLLGVQYGALALAFVILLVGGPSGITTAAFVTYLIALVARLWLDHVRSAQWQRERRARWEAAQEDARSATERQHEL